MAAKTLGGAEAHSHFVADGVYYLNWTLKPHFHTPHTKGIDSARNGDFGARKEGNGSKRMSKQARNNHSSNLDTESLAGQLWGAANILRGPVDAADFKTYIFPLLFFKRLSDVFDEEYSLALKESDGDVEFAEFPENHRFQIPEGCHWKDVRAKSANIGHALQTAMRCIEQANPETLHGIFGDAQWTNRSAFGRSAQGFNRNFSSLNLGNEHCKAVSLARHTNTDQEFADLTNKKAGEFYTRARWFR